MTTWITITPQQLITLEWACGPVGHKHITPAQIKFLQHHKVHHLRIKQYLSNISAAQIPLQRTYAQMFAHYCGLTWSETNDPNIQQFYSE